jgi:hypothetical protein
MGIHYLFGTDNTNLCTCKESAGGKATGDNVGRDETIPMKVGTVICRMMSVWVLRNVDGISLRCGYISDKHLVGGACKISDGQEARR